MRLKLWTTVCFVAGLILLATWPFVVGPKPDKADRHALKQYLLTSSYYFMALLILFATTVVLAWLVSRQTREEYAEESISNLEGLISGTLSDHSKKESDESKPE